MRASSLSPEHSIVRTAARWGRRLFLAHTAVVFLLLAVEAWTILPSWDLLYTLGKIDFFVEPLSRWGGWHPPLDQTARLIGLGALTRLWQPFCFFFWGGLFYFLVGALAGAVVHQRRRRPGDGPSDSIPDAAK